MYKVKKSHDENQPAVSFFIWYATPIILMCIYSYFIESDSMNSRIDKVEISAWSATANHGFHYLNSREFLAPQ
jgi:hypothetical protein